MLHSLEVHVQEFTDRLRRQVIIFGIKTAKMVIVSLQSVAQKHIKNDIYLVESIKDVDQRLVKKN